VSHKPSGYARPKADLYETPEWVTRALLRHFPLAAGSSVWEPAAGNHKMANVLAAAGALVIATDIATYSRRHAFIVDFLAADALPIKCDAIITNPPYGHTNRKAALFARLALTRCDGLVAILCTAKFDFGSKRYDLFGNNPRFAAKIALTDRVNWFEGKDDNTESHAWYVWAPTAFAAADPRLLYAGKEAA
jgi:predicted RNA methylase